MINARRAAIEQKITHLRAQVAVLERERVDLDIAARVFAKLAAEAVELSANASLRGVSPDESRENGTIPQHANPVDELDEHIRQIILEQGRPVPRSQIIDGLRARGVKIKHKQPGPSIGMLMKRRPQMFKSFEPQGWWLVDRPYPPLDYYPTDAPE